MSEIVIPSPFTSPDWHLWHKNVFMLGVDDCWEWQGTCFKEKDYGRMRGVGAHRMTWQMIHGRPIPRGMHICHTCDNPPCVNPNHLFLGTPQDNALDAIAKMRRRSPLDNRPCKRGHPFDEKNTYWTPAGIRQCRTCRAMHQREWHRRRREVAV